MEPLLINDSLFFWHKGRVRFSWCLPWDDDYTDEDRQAFISWALDRGVDGVMMRLLDERIATPFKNGEFMGELDHIKFEKFMNFICKIKALGGKMVFCLFDGPQQGKACKYPYHHDRVGMENFIKFACQVLRPFAYAFVLGCETNEYFDVATVKYGIQLMKKYAPGIPCSSHEQWNPDKREFIGGDFCCYETRNHPRDGDKRSVGDMVNEVNYVISKLPPHVNMWVSEFNWNNSERCIQQARAIAEIPRVIGVGMPLR